MSPSLPTPPLPLPRCYYCRARQPPRHGHGHAPTRASLLSHAATIVRPVLYASRPRPLVRVSRPRPLVRASRPRPLIRPSISRPLVRPSRPPEPLVRPSGPRRPPLLVSHALPRTLRSVVPQHGGLPEPPSGAAVLPPGAVPALGSGPPGQPAAAGPGTPVQDQQQVRGAVGGHRTNNVRMYVCMYICMYVCMYVRMYVCMYVRMYVPYE